MEHDANVFIKVPTSESSDDSEIQKRAKPGCLDRRCTCSGRLLSNTSKFYKIFLLMP